MTLTRKLVLAFLAVCIVGALLAVVFARLLTVQEFNQLVIEQAQTDFIDRSADYYATNGSWQGVALYFRDSPKPPYLQQQPRPPEGIAPFQPTFAFTLVDQNGIVVVPGGIYKMREYIPAEIFAQGEPVEVDGITVGTVIASGEPPELTAREEGYLERTNRALLYAAGGAALLALALGIFLARGLTSPVRELTNATRLMAKGKLGQQVKVQSHDEIGELGSAFNQMSSELKRLVDQRQQMTADIAHDLRTPLTVIDGYIEAMQDSVLEATPERLETIYKEVQHLKRLVADLRTLSLAEAGQLSLNPVRFSPQVLLKQAEAAYRLTAEQKEVQLTVLASEECPEIMIDPDRMMQVLGNLLDNALRHTPAGGSIQLKTVSSQDSVDLIVVDSGEGISPDNLPYIFDRFYRMDDSRQEHEGESGLGLAIASSIVALHGGELMAHSEGQGRGSTFTIRLPMKK
ncbi:ATP-binding protein [Chloroflexota bacterium]